MCGRYTLTASNKPDLAALKFDLPDRYNIAPQSEVLVETRLDGYTMKPWSLSPPWATTPMHLFNARLETLDEKPSFKGSLRCVFWQTVGTSGSARQTINSRGITIERAG